MINIIIEVLKNASKNSYFCPFCPPWDAQGGHFALLPPPVHAPGFEVRIELEGYFELKHKITPNFELEPYFDPSALRLS